MSLFALFINLYYHHNMRSDKRVLSVVVPIDFFNLLKEYSSYTGESMSSIAGGAIVASQPALQASLDAIRLVQRNRATLTDASYQGIMAKLLKAQTEAMEALESVSERLEESAHVSK